MYMDFAQALIEERGYGDYVRLPLEHLPLLWLAYLSDPSNSGKIHSDVKVHAALTILAILTILTILMARLPE